MSSNNILCILNIVTIPLTKCGFSHCAHRLFFFTNRKVQEINLSQIVGTAHSGKKFIWNFGEKNSILKDLPTYLYKM